MESENAKCLRPWSKAQLLLLLLWIASAAISNTFSWDAHLKLLLNKPSKSIIEGHRKQCIMEFHGNTCGIRLVSFARYSSLPMMVIQKCDPLLGCYKLAIVKQLFRKINDLQTNTQQNLRITSERANFKCGQSIVTMRFCLSLRRVRMTGSADGIHGSSNMDAHRDGGPASAGRFKIKRACVKNNS